MVSKLSRLLKYKKNISQHLTELSHLCGHLIYEKDLVSLQETDTIRKQALNLQTPTNKFEVDFSEIVSIKFKGFIKKLYLLNSHPIYLWTTLGNDCGLLKIDSILEFNFSFEYSSIKEGIIVLLTEDCSDQMTLDFFENSARQRKLEIELVGKSWTTICY